MRQHPFHQRRQLPVDRGRSKVGPTARINLPHQRAQPGLRDRDPPDAAVTRRRGKHDDGFVLADEKAQIIHLKRGSELVETSRGACGCQCFARELFVRCRFTGRPQLRDRAALRGLYRGECLVNALKLQRAQDNVFIEIGKAAEERSGLQRVGDAHAPPLDRLADAAHRVERGRVLIQPAADNSNRP